MTKVSDFKIVQLIHAILNTTGWLLAVCLTNSGMSGELKYMYNLSGLVLVNEHEQLTCTKTDLR